MSSLKFITSYVLIGFTLFTIAPGYARYSKPEENQMKTIFMDTFYGMAAGSLIATAISLTQHDPNWGQNVGTGAAIGGIAGALFGIVTETTYIASIDNGNLSVGIPSIQANVDRKDGNSVFFTAGVFQYKF